MSAYYRRYRPQVFSELDNEKARVFLDRLVASGTATHAYLFTGPKGTGKTTCARLLAKAVNCTRTATTALVEPCGTCDGCTTIAVGSCVDVLEIDAASNRGIDEIRALREKIVLAPTLVRCKVYIIDEVHMLTTEAFSALLKTLEEPPPHALFVLCTTEPHKVPATVASRCQQVLFERATHEEIKRSLSRVLAAEKRKVSGEVVSAIVGMCEGSFRDAVKLLEQVLAQSDNPTAEDISLLRHSGSGADRHTFLEALLHTDASAALALIRQWETQGIDFVSLANDLLFDLRICFLLKQGVAAERIDASRATLYKALTQEVSLGKITEVLRCVAARYEDIRRLPIPAVALELIVGEWALKYGEESRTRRQTEDSDGQAKVPSKAKLPHRPVSPDRGEREESAGDGKSQHSSSFSLTLQEVIDKWSLFAASIKVHNQALGTIIRQAKPVEVSGTTVTTEVPYPFHRDKLQQSKTRKLLGELAAEVFGMAVTLDMTIATRPMRKKDVANVDVPMEDTEVLQAVADIFGAEPALGEASP